MLEEIKKWSRADWQAFDEARRIAFEPTSEEIQQRDENIKQSLVFQVQQYLALYDIHFTGNETDFTELYTLYIKGGGSEKNNDMKELMGGEDVLNETLQYRIDNFNNLQDFCQFILSYE